MNFEFYAEVITFSGIPKSLTYGIPTILLNEVKIGSLVEVTIGNSINLGIAIKIGQHFSGNFEVKPIRQCLHKNMTLNNELIQLAKWISTYYAASMRSVFESIIPSAIRSEKSAKINSFLSINKNFNYDFENLQKKSPKQFAAYTLIKDSESVSKTEILKTFSHVVIIELLKKKLILETKIQHKRLAYNDEFAAIEYIKKEIILNDEQQKVSNNIKSFVHQNKFSTHLLYGITGSGKTEVYIELINEVLSRGGGVIYLVPELALTPQTVGRVKGGIKSDQNIIVWHSGLSEGERRDAWLELASGNSKIVIGARSSVFAPVKNLKLVIVDEEHETTYKQSETPRYNARDVAVYRSKLNNAVCVLGSATPSIESLFNTKFKNYQLEKLTSRIDNNKLPEIEIVDMKHEKFSSIPSVLSSRLVDLMFDRLKKHEQIILFLNRRGYAQTVYCKHCDYIAKCPNCNVSLTYHKNDGALRCHLCDYIESIPDKCLNCGSSAIIDRGIGTEKLEQIVRRIFTNANIARIDSDVITSKNIFRKILSEFKQGTIDILIGTQMIAKGLDFPNVSLVGVIDADGALSSPDFRSAERAFQLITQVSGRAGRSEKKGNVIIQTRNPSNKIINFAKNHMFDEFTNNEFNNRKEFEYPPYRHIIMILISCHDSNKVKTFSENLYEYLRKNITDARIEIRPAIPCIIEKINNRFRYNILIFTTNVSQTLKIVTEARKNFEVNKTIHEVIDVDPLEIY